MPKQRFQFASAVHLLFIQNENILLLSRRNTGYEDGSFGVPAGHLDGGETVLSAAVREAKEETGLSLRLENVHLAHVMHWRNESEEYIYFFVRVDAWEGVPVNAEPQKCAELRWFPLDGLPPNVIPSVRAAIHSVIRGELYSDFGF